MSNNLEAGLASLVNQFKSDVNAHVANYLSATLGGAVGVTNGASKKNGKSNGHAVTNGDSALGKGEKRSAEAIEAFQTQFVEFVKKNPGLRIEQINKELGTTTKQLQLPIRKLIADGVIKVKGEKRASCYFTR